MIQPPKNGRAATRQISPGGPASRCPSQTSILKPRANPWRPNDNPCPSPIIISPKRRHQSNPDGPRTDSPVARSGHCPLMPPRPLRTSAKPTRMTTQHRSPIPGIGPNTIRPATPCLAPDRRRPGHAIGWPWGHPPVAARRRLFLQPISPLPKLRTPRPKTTAVVPTDLRLVENDYRSTTLTAAANPKPSQAQTERGWSRVASKTDAGVSLHT